jgi:hypothetical protein
MVTHFGERRGLVVFKGGEIRDEVEEQQAVPDSKPWWINFDSPCKEKKLKKMLTERKKRRRNEHLTSILPDGHLNFTDLSSLFS